MAVDAGTGAWLPQEPRPAMLSPHHQPGVVVLGSGSRSLSPAAFSRLPSSRASTTSGPLGTGSAPRRQGPLPRAHDPGTPSGPQPCRGGILLDPWPLGSSCEAPSWPTHPEPSGLAKGEQPAQRRLALFSQRPHHGRLSGPRPGRWARGRGGWGVDGWPCFAPGWH